MKKLMIIPLIAGCTQAQLASEQTTPQAMPTAGIYQSFDAKGGGEVLGDTFVRPVGVAAEDVRIAAVPTRSGSCWDGSRGVDFGPVTLCPAKPSNVVVFDDGDGPVVVSSSNPPDDGNDDDDGPNDGDPNDPNGGDPNDPNGGDPNDPNGGDPNDPNGGNPNDPNGGDPNDPNGGNPNDPNGGDPNDPNGDDPNNGFTGKYDRLNEVYGTTFWQGLPADDRKDIIDYYNEVGPDADWSGFKEEDENGAENEDAPQNGEEAANNEDAPESSEENGA